jgi:hypothetical protein
MESCNFGSYKGNPQTKSIRLNRPAEHRTLVRLPGESGAEIILARLMLKSDLRNLELR